MRSGLYELDLCDEESWCFLSLVFSSSYNLCVKFTWFRRYMSSETTAWLHTKEHSQQPIPAQLCAVFNTRLISLRAFEIISTVSVTYASSNTLLVTKSPTWVQYHIFCRSAAATSFGELRERPTLEEFRNGLVHFFEHLDGSKILAAAFGLRPRKTCQQEHDFHSCYTKLTWLIALGVLSSETFGVFKGFWHGRSIRVFMGWNIQIASFERAWFRLLLGLSGRLAVAFPEPGMAVMGGYHAKVPKVKQT